MRALAWSGDPGGSAASPAPLRPSLAHRISGRGGIGGAWGGCRRPALPPMAHLRKGVTASPTALGRGTVEPCDVAYPSAFSASSPSGSDGEDEQGSLSSSFRDGASGRSRQQQQQQRRRRRPRQQRGLPPGSDASIAPSGRSRPGTGWSDGGKRSPKARRASGGSTFTFNPLPPAHGVTDNSRLSRFLEPPTLPHVGSRVSPARVVPLPVSHLEMGMGDHQKDLLRELRRIKGSSKRHKQTVMDLLGRSRKENLKLLTVHYNVAMAVMARGRDLSAAKGLMRDMQEAGLKPTIVTFNTLLHACAKVGNVKYACHILQEIKSSPQLEPDQVTYASAILALAHSNESDLALELLGEMRGKGIPPNAHVYNSLANVLLRAGRVKEAESCINDMAQDGIRRDSTTWNIILKMCVEKKEWKRALTVASRMPELGAAMDGHGFGAATSAALALDDWKQALQILSSWKATRGQVTTATYAAIIQCVCKNGEWERGASILEELRSKEKKVTVPMYAAIIQAAADAGQWEAALSYKQQMPEVCHKAAPPANLYASIMKAALRWGQYDVVQSIFDEGLREAKGPMTPEAHFTALKAACKQPASTSTVLNLFRSWSACLKSGKSGKQLRGQDGKDALDVWLLTLRSLAREGSSACEEDFSEVLNLYDRTELECLGMPGEVSTACGDVLSVLKNLSLEVKPPAFIAELA